jgi:hypothetical protein
MRLIREIKDRTGKTVFKRWLLLRTPWFSIFIHGMYDRRGDQDAHCHDHPWNFWSLILWGGYFEVVHDTVNHHYGVRHLGSVQYMPARGIYHRVIELNRSRSYSLVVASRETVPWGYWTQGRLDRESAVPPAQARRQAAGEGADDEQGSSRRHAPGSCAPGALQGRMVR